MSYLMNLWRKKEKVKKKKKEKNQILKSDESIYEKNLSLHIPEEEQIVILLVEYVAKQGRREELLRLRQEILIILHTIEVV